MLVVNAVDDFVLLPDKLYNLSRICIIFTKQVNIGFDIGHIGHVFSQCSTAYLWIIIYHNLPFSLNIYM